MTDTTSHEYKITETRVFDDGPGDSDDGTGWDQHADAMTAASAEGWELVSTQLSFVAGSTRTRGSAKTGQLIETHHPERRALSVWRRPASS